MRWTTVLSAALIVLVIFWSAGATVELFVTTFSIGDRVTAAGVTVVLVAVAILAMVAIGVRGSRGLENPDSYW